MAALNIAYEAPDNYRGFNPSARRPIDLVHLANQTMGDKSLEVEVLQIFSKTLRQSMRDLAQSSQADASQIAHRMCGSARAVGAFAVSDAARDIEEQGMDAARLAVLHAAVIDVENFIQGLTR